MSNYYDFMRDCNGPDLYEDALMGDPDDDCMPDDGYYDEDPDLGVSDDNWACGTLDVEF